jgi:molybdopterin molybdotransferase
MSQQPLISPTEAYALINDDIGALPSCEASLLEAAGFYLAETIASAESLPAHDNSGMDGFAVRAADIAGASDENPIILKIIGEAPAGQPFDGEVGEGQTTKIFTGGLIPKGCTAVVPVEQSRPAVSGASDEVAIVKSVQEGQHIRPAGMDIQAGDVLLDAGDQLDAGALGVLAAIGRARVQVYHKPRVALLMSGDELVPPDATPEAGQVRDVSTYTLRPLLRELGCEVINLGQANDDADELKRVLEPALNDADALITCGGVSMGEYDLLRPVLAEMGMEELFWKIAQRPGKPMVYGRCGDCAYFGLPGNPISVWTCFHLYVVPMLRKMRGAPRWEHPAFPVLMGEPVELRPPLTHFLRARLQDVGGRLTAYLTGAQGSNITRSLLHQDVMLVVPPDVDKLAPGDEAQALAIHSQRTLSILAEHQTLRQQAHGGHLDYLTGLSATRPQGE